jgi:hypothetical protein
MLPSHVEQFCESIADQYINESFQSHFLKWGMIFMIIFKAAQSPEFGPHIKLSTVYTHLFKLNFSLLYSCSSVSISCYRRNQ